MESVFGDEDSSTDEADELVHDDLGTADREARIDTEAVCKQRVEEGTWVLDSNTCFTWTTHLGHTASIRIKPRWCEPDRLGKEDVSKALTITVQTYFRVQAWMVMRFEQPGVVGSTSLRVKSLLDETQRLRDGAGKRAVSGVFTVPILHHIPWTILSFFVPARHVTFLVVGFCSCVQVTDLIVSI